MDDEFLNADEEDFETDDFDEADEEEAEEESAEEAKEKESPPAQPTDHIVHIYEYGKFTRTIEREFTAEDAEAFASDYNRTARAYSRFAMAAKAKSRPKKTVPWPVFKGASK